MKYAMTLSLMAGLALVGCAPSEKPAPAATDKPEATTGETATLFRRLCELEKIPVQDFANRSDLACGSTIGPLTASELGVRTVDVGIPQLAMHSARELCGAHDPHYLFRVLRRHFEIEIPSSSGLLAQEDRDRRVPVPGLLTAVPHHLVADEEEPCPGSNRVFRARTVGI